MIPVICAYLCSLSVGRQDVQYRHHRAQSDTLGLTFGAGRLDVISHHHNNGSQLVLDDVLP